MIDITPGGDQPENPDASQSGGGVRVLLPDPESRPPGAQASVPVRLTDGMAGTGGRIKDEPRDFIVDEIPLYEPCGHGEHLYLRIEKRDLSHEKMVEHLGRSLNISRHDVGTAGMKDRRAITRQWVSVPARCADKIGQIECEQVHVLDAAKHTNSLKRGHCRGNRFTIRINDVESDAESTANAVAQRLVSKGCPNYYGPQRFGIDGETLLTGFRLVTGELAPTSIHKGRRKFLTRLGLSALQSALFNDVIALRVSRGLFHEVLPGDVMTFPNSRSVFEAADAEAEQRRYDAGEIVITGPMFGVKMRGPTGVSAELERQALDSRGLRIGQFKAWRSIAPGSRRPISVRPEFHSITIDQNSLCVEMTLPSGSFATVVLDELMKV